MEIDLEEEDTDVDENKGKNQEDYSYNCDKCKETTYYSSAHLINN